MAEHQEEGMAKGLVVGFFSGAIVGAVIGVGLTKGMRAVSRRRIGTIMAGWVLTPVCAAVFAALLYRILNTLI